MYRVLCVHSWQNGTRCRDGVKGLWHHSHLVWLFFEGSIPTCTVLRVVPVKREEWWKGRPREDAWSIKYVVLFTRNSCKRFQVNL